MREKKVERKPFDKEACPIFSSVDVIGGTWKPVIIWVLLDGSMRFGEIHQSIHGIALKVLSRNLKELEQDGIVSRKAYPEVPPRVEYSLTEKGKSLSTIMNALADWSREYIIDK